MQNITLCGKDKDVILENNDNKEYHTFARLNEVIHEFF
tara:strand:- start:1410 stop:1523 length:114 start_codon:yes stop_codon:yes gene_type:complete